MRWQRTFVAMRRLGPFHHISETLHALRRRGWGRYIFSGSMCGRSSRWMGSGCHAGRHGTASSSRGRGCLGGLSRVGGWRPGERYPRRLGHGVARSHHRRRRMSRRFSLRRRRWWWHSRRRIRPRKLLLQFLIELFQGLPGRPRRLLRPKIGVIESIPQLFSKMSRRPFHGVGDTALQCVLNRPRQGLVNGIARAHVFPKTARLQVGNADMSQISHVPPLVGLFTNDAFGFDDLLGPSAVTKDLIEGASDDFSG